MDARTSDARDGFGAQLRRHRLAAGLTQEALADRAGLSVRGIADLERGVRRFPHFHTLRRLVEALELSPPDRAALMLAGQPRPESTEPAPSTTPWRCARCERANAPVARFCVGCGRPVELPCSACGTMGDQPDRFCHACGASLVTGAPAEPPVQAEGQPVEPPLTVAEGEHKQATILFCQLADPGALAERLGQERMLAFLDRFFEQAHAEVAHFEARSAAS